MALVTDAEAQRLAMTVATSPLVKTAAYGEDSNWGTGARGGRPRGCGDRSPTNGYLLRAALHVPPGNSHRDLPEKAREPLKAPEVVITIRVHQGKAQGLYWTCDFTGQYVDINARYRRNVSPPNP